MPAGIKVLSAYISRIIFLHCVVDHRAQKAYLSNLSTFRQFPFLLLLLLDNQQTPLSWDVTLMTNCRGSELRQAIPEDVQGIALDNRPIECIPLRNCAREKVFLRCDVLVLNL